MSWAANELKAGS